MRRISFFFFSTLSALVLLFSYRTSLGDATVVSSATSAHAHVVSGTATANSITPGSATASAPIITVPNPTSAAAPQAAPAPAAPAAPAPAAPAVASVIDGDSVNTSYGPVQVEITVTGGVITAAQAINYPNNDREDRQINSRAIPLLNSQVLSAQSAKIDGVSGATYTSDGYLRSLQSAIDVAGLS